MENISNEIIERLENLNLISKNFQLSKKIVVMAIISVKNYIKCEINSFIDFSLIKETFIQIVIGEYLTLIKNSNLDEDMNFETAIKSISEGDISITYFTERLETKEDKLNKLIDYFLGKKRLLLSFKSIRW